MNSSISSNHRTQAFWDHDITILNVFRVTERNHPWYQKHVEQFISFQPGALLKQRSAEDVQNWLQTLCNQPQVSTWQFRQKINALRLMYSQLFKSSWSKDFDSDYWANRARIRVLVLFVIITYIKQLYRKQPEYRQRMRVLSNGSPATRYGIHSPQICLSQVPTSGKYRNCSVTMM